jgi:hypothetical protein
MGDVLGFQVSAVDWKVVEQIPQDKLLREHAALLGPEVTAGR